MPPTSIVITAARSEQSLPDALPSTHVIRRAEIEALQPADLPGLLRALTSIDVAQTGPLGSQTSLFLRGADSRQTLVLIDGVPLQRADFGSASWQNLPIEQIERVEIVRGNLSSLYGAQAIGGVVQIITRRALTPQVSVSAGSQDTVAAAAAGGIELGSGNSSTRVSASLSARKTGGYSARDPAVDPAANPDLDPARQAAGSVQLEQRWADGHRTLFNLLAGTTHSAYDGFTPGLDDVLTTHTDAAGLSSQHALRTDLVLSANLGQTRERMNDPTGFAPVVDNLVRLAGLQLAWQPSPRARMAIRRRDQARALQRLRHARTRARHRQPAPGLARPLGWCGPAVAVAGQPAQRPQQRLRRRNDGPARPGLHAASGMEGECAVVERILGTVVPR